MLKQSTSLKRIRLLTNSYKRDNLDNRHYDALCSLAETAMTLFPDNAFGFNLMQQLNSSYIAPKDYSLPIINETKNKAHIFSKLLFELSNINSIQLSIDILKTGLTTLNLNKAFSEINDIDDLRLKRKLFLLLQQVFPTNEIFYLRLAEFYTYDFKIQSAYTLLSIGCIYTKGYIYVKKFAFELEHSMFPEALRTFESILLLDNYFKFLYYSMILRVSDLFTPEIDDLMFKYDKSVADYIEDYKFSNKTARSYFTNLLRQRRINLAKNFLDRKFLKSKDVLVTTFNSILNKLGFLLDLVPLATKNQHCIDPLCYSSDNELIDFKTAKRLNKKCVEFYIPSVFFTMTDDEKPTYDTVRTFYKNIYAILHSIDDVVIIPFHQYNWRNSANIIGEFGISYHTHSDQASPRWLHIQESVLNARCTMDSKGFAGFSSIAVDYDLINNFTEGVSLEDLSKNYNAMHRYYVEQNISKYTQNQTDFICNEKYVFLPMQVRTDIVASLASISCLDILKSLISYLHSDYKIVVKRHPYCNSLEIYDELELLRDNKRVIITDSSIHSILKGCSAVFTANSGVGFEALLHKKPVYTTGLSDYMYAITGLLKSPEDFQHLPNKFFADENKILRYLYFVNKYYAIDCTDTNNIKERILHWLNT